MSPQERVAEYKRLRLALEEERALAAVSNEHAIAPGLEADLTALLAARAALDGFVLALIYTLNDARSE